MWEIVHKIVFPKNNSCDWIILAWKISHVQQVYEHTISTAFDVTLVSWFERTHWISQVMSLVDSRIKNYFSYIFNGKNSDRFILNLDGFLQCLISLKLSEWKRSHIKWFIIKIS